MNRVHASSVAVRGVRDSELADHAIIKLDRRHSGVFLVDLDVLVLTEFIFNTVPVELPERWVHVLAYTLGRKQPGCRVNLFDIAQ